MQFSDGSLHSFLNSAMNIEFVYLILLGINKFNKDKIQERNARVSLNASDIQNASSLAEDEFVGKLRAQQHKNSINFDNIEFANINMWNVDKSTDTADTKI